MGKRASEHRFEGQVSRSPVGNQHCQAQQPQINVAHALLKTRRRLSTKFGGLKLPNGRAGNNTVKSVFIAAESCRQRSNT